MRASGNNRLNLEDIAAKAGVSRSTVSRVINNEPYVKEKTRTKVLAIIKQEGYSPNPAARTLVTQRSQVIGVVIPHVPMQVFEDAYYFPTLLQGVSRITHERDYAMLLWLGQFEDENEHFYQRIERNRLMDGLIFASASSHDPLIDHLLETYTPFVLVERPGHDYDRISYVSVDNLTASFDLITHLIKLGRRRIGMITGNLDIPDARDRLEGYKLALQTAGLPVDEALVARGNFTHRSGYDGMQRLLETKPDAIFASSDITARGVLLALQEVGVRVPEDIAVVGFDDLPTAVQVTPSLTTVRQPIEEKGARATQILIDLIENPDKPPQQIMLPTTLVIRESCGAHL